VKKAFIKIMPLWCTGLFCVGLLGNIQRCITRAEPLHDSVNPLFCDFFAVVVVCIRSPLWSIKSHDVDISVFCLLLYLRFKPQSHWKIASEQNCAVCRFPLWKSLYHSPMEISGNSHLNFWSNGKRPLSAHSTRPRKIPWWIVLVHENLSLKKWANRQ